MIGLPLGHETPRVCLLSDLMFLFHFFDNAARYGIDKAAAARFINAAIKSGKKSGDGDDSDSVQGPSGTHTRFDDDDNVASDKTESAVPSENEIAAKAADRKDKGKKSKRPKMDPFAGGLRI